MTYALNRKPEGFLRPAEVSQFLETLTDWCHVLSMVLNLQTAHNMYEIKQAMW